MKKIPLGPAGIEVSTLCLGAMRFGTTTDEATSFAILDAYVAAGGNFIDTANVYAAWGGGVGGESEALLGRWLQARGGRDRLIIASKAGSRLQPGGRSLRREVLERECEASLRRLGIETIDVYYAHFDDMTLPAEQIMENFQCLIAAGKVRHIAASNHYAWRLEQARQAAARSYCCVQQRYSYLQPVTGASFGVQLAVNDDLVAYLRAYRLPLVAFSPLLAGIYDHPERELPPQYMAPVNTQRLDVIRALAQERGVSANQLVFAWMLHHDFPVIPIVGATSVAQLAKNLAAADIALSAAEMRRLNLEKP
jgi:aryl-alcohol dehydrogenase-like predicted oxidoreductase